MEDRDFNPRTALAIARVADEMGVSKHDVEAFIAQDDTGRSERVSFDAYDKIVESDPEGWQAAAIGFIEDLIEHGYVEIDPDFAVNFVIESMAKAALEKAKVIPLG